MFKLMFKLLNNTFKNLSLLYKTRSLNLYKRTVLKIDFFVAGSYEYMNKLIKLFFSRAFLLDKHISVTYLIKMTRR